MLQCNASRFRAVTRLNQTGLVDIQVSDRLVDTDQPDLLADARHLEHLIGQNHLRIIQRLWRARSMAASRARSRVIVTEGGAIKSPSPTRLTLPDALPLFQSLSWAKPRKANRVRNTHRGNPNNSSSRNEYPIPKM